MEGIGGVSTGDVQASAKGPEYDQFRRLMTIEVDAAIAGAFDAGATEGACRRFIVAPGQGQRRMGISPNRRFR